MSHGGWGVSRHIRPITCGHPEREHYAKGLCRSCYRNTPEFQRIRHAYYMAHRDAFQAQGEKRRAAGGRVKQLYGLEPSSYLAMVDAQAGLCAICGREPGKKGLCVDHDHATGRVRALLCARCNLALGALKDDAALCRAAARYLDHHRHSL